MGLHRAGRPRGVLTDTANLIKSDNKQACGCTLEMGVGRTRQHFTLKTSIMAMVFNLIQPLEVDPKWRFAYVDVYNDIIFKW